MGAGDNGKQIDEPKTNVAETGVGGSASGVSNIKGTTATMTEEERGIITKAKGCAPPLWSTPQLDTFIKEVDALKDGMGLNLKRIREIDEEVQSRKELLIKKARSMLADLEETSASAAAAAANQSNHPKAQEEKRCQTPTKVPGKEEAFLQKQEAIALEFYDLITRSENKFHIASQTYDLADMHTCRLDKALKSLEDELRAQRRMASLYDQGTTAARASTSVVVGRGGARSGSGRGRGGSNQKKALGRNGSSKLKGSGKLKGSNTNTQMGGITAGQVQLVDPIQAGVAPMVVDPSEPTYCYCNRVSFGQMVGCDNDDCLWEWFHIDCVGILPHNMPKGKWYCPECRKQLKKGG